MDITNINTDISDRFLGEDIKLPYIFDQIKIQGNEISNCLTVNNSLDKLFQNFLYLYNQTQIITNNIPVSSLGIYGNFNNIVSWYNSTSSAQFSAFTDSFNNCQTINVNLSSNLLSIWLGAEQYLLNLTTPITLTSTSIVLSTNKTDIGSTYYYDNISDITLLDSNVYVTDSGNNSIFKYSYSNNTLDVKKILGGIGTSRDNFKFNNPTRLVNNLSNIYILDKNNNCIKIYDLNLNWLSTFNIKQITNKTVSHIFLSDTYFYLITTDNYILQFTFEFKLISTVSLNINDEIRNVFVSKTNTNILYIVTTRTIYKRYISKPQYNIGTFQSNLFYVSPTDIFVSGESVKVNNLEYIFVIITDNVATKIINFIDNNDYITLLLNKHFDAVPLSAINIDPNEYNQTINYNQSIQLLLKNHIALQNNLTKTFVGTLNERNELIYQYLQYVDNQSISNENDLNYYIGQNEIFSNSVINRCFYNIFKIQESIANLLTPIVVSTNVSTNTPVVLE